MTVGDNAGSQLVSFVERLERLAEERQAMTEDMREVMAEAKSAGFDTKIIRRVLGLRKMDETARKELLHLTDTYMQTLDRFEKQAIDRNVAEGS